MALIKWDDSFSVKVSQIDQQHQKLVNMINELHDAMKQGKGNDAVGKIIAGLISYTQLHFKTEEDYFDRLGYPGKALHKQEHDAFVRKVSDFKVGFEQGKLSLTIEVMNFLSDWLQKHIKGTDMQYTKFFNEKGVN